MKATRVFEMECRWMPDSKGGVTTWLETKQHRLQIYVTKAGKVRIWKDGVELAELMAIKTLPKGRKRAKKETA